jgi:leucyl aminopeptidase
MAASDPVWQLPLWQPYASGLDNPVADTSNITTGGFAGSITAGLFLEKFIGKCPSWAHFNVFAWNPSSRPGRPEGGEAQAYRAVYALLQERYAAKKAKGKR